MRDFNGDGLLDLAVSDSPDCGCGYMSVLLGKGDGTFGSPTTYNLPAYGGSILAANFSHSRKVDIAIESGGAIYVFLGNGDGTFQAPVEYGSDYAAGSMATGDFNRDGLLDVVISNFNGNGSTTASVML